MKEKARVCTDKFRCKREVCVVMLLSQGGTASNLSVLSALVTQWWTQQVRPAVSDDGTSLGDSG